MKALELAQLLLKEDPDAIVYDSNGVEITDFNIQDEDLYINNTTFEIGNWKDMFHSGGSTLIMSQGSIVLE